MLKLVAITCMMSAPTTVPKIVARPLAEMANGELVDRPHDRDADRSARLVEVGAE